jgi:hypothetical protein
MIERIVEDNDPFANLRDGNNLLWLKFKQRIEALYPDRKIPEENEKHLNEFFVYRDRLYNEVGFQGDLITFNKEFSNYHDPFFEDPLFSNAIKMITEAMGAPLVTLNNDGWVR